jgi:diadenosine tetraphosphatase ApaH/serine/threonine PP2A family protein phosphatase
MIDDVLRANGLQTWGGANATIGMSVEESSTLLHWLRRPSTQTYIEWGSGGSTELVSWLIISRQVSRNFHALSIESSQAWMHHMRTRNSLVAQAEQMGQLSFVHGSLGSTGHLGYPKAFNPRDRARSFAYVGLSDKLHNRRIDIALVDGRFRLACTLEAYKHFQYTQTLLWNRSKYFKSKYEPVVFLHDYALKPPGLHQRRFDEYSQALRYFDLKQRNDTLATLTPKLNVPMHHLEHDLQRALSLPD